MTAGILSVKGEELADAVYFLQNSEGGGLAPYDSWLCLRGLKTMALRMRAQQSNCMAIAQWLQAHPLVRKINYPGLPTDPGYALQMRQASRSPAPACAALRQPSSRASSQPSRAAFP